MHAASFLRQRLIVLDRELLLDPVELKRIWLHELFHFVWWKLNNATRLAWEQVLLLERGRGELGWSAEWRKIELTAHDRKHRTRRWREYCCESFCDSGAWIALFAAAQTKHPEATLAARATRARLQWWAKSIRYNSSGPIDS